MESLNTSRESKKLTQEEKQALYAEITSLIDYLELIARDLPEGTDKDKLVEDIMKFKLSSKTVFD